MSVREIGPNVNVIGPGTDLNAAFNNFPFNYMKAGVYTPTASVKITNKTRILAEKGAIVRYPAGSGTFNLIEITNEVIVEGLEIDGNQANVTNALVGTNDDKQSLIVLKEGASNSKVLNCYIHDSWNAGVWVEPVSGGTVINVEIAGNHFKNIGFGQKQSSNSIYCFRNGGAGTGRNQIHNNYIEQQQDKTVGIYLHFDTDSLVQNNEIFSTVSYTGAGIGIQVDDQAAKQNAITGNHISGMVHGIFIDWSGTDAVIISNNYVENGINAGGAGTGIILTNSTSGPPTMKCLVVANNICRNNAGPGIDVQASHVIVIGNICYDNNANQGGSASNKSGIKITNPGSSATLTDILVIGNNCFDSGAATQQYGFSCDNTSGAINKVYVFNNNFQTNVSGGVGNLLTTDTAQLINNLGYNPQAVSGVLTAGASAYTVPAQPYPYIFLLQAANGISAMTLDGVAVPITINQPILVNPGHTLIVTWATTAPTFKELPQ